MKNVKNFCQAHFIYIRKRKIKRPNNPYITGGVVGGSRFFVGRTNILRAIEKILCHSQQNIVILFGEQRIGKTSVLKELEDKLKKVDMHKPFNVSKNSKFKKIIFFEWFQILKNFCLPTKDYYQLIYIDLTNKKHQLLEMLLNYLAEKLCSQLEELNIEKPQWNNIKDQFSDWLLDLLNEQLIGKSFVLLFDEVNAINDAEQQVRQELFDYLEMLSSLDTKKLNVIFTSGCDYKENFKLALFPYQNINEYHISYFSKKETYELIRSSKRNRSLYWSLEAVKKVWELTHGHPLLTQQLCACLWRQAWSQNPTKIPTITIEQIEKSTCKEVIAKLINQLK